MIVWTHPWEIKVSYGDTIKVVSFGDIHFGAESCNLKRFEENVLAKNAEDPNAYFLCMGDLFDAITHKDPRFRPVESGQGFRGVTNIIDKQIDEMVKLYKKYDIPPHRLLGSAHGNHEDTVLVKSGVNMTDRFCYATGQKNLGMSFFLRLMLKMKGSTTAAPVPLVFYGHHGYTGGRKIGGSANSFVDHSTRFPGAHVYLYGHNHKKFSFRVPTVSPNFITGEQEDVSVVIGNTGTYMMTNSVGPEPSYAEKAGYPPAELGHLEILATPTREQVKQKNGKPSSKRILDIRVVE